MNPDESAVRAWARLGEALAEEILGTPDADLAGVFPGRSGRVAADAWRQMVRRIAAPPDGAGAPVTPMLHDIQIERDRGEDTP